MPAPSTQDFTKGADFTGINPVAATDLNQLVDAATTFNNGNVIEGTGIIIITKDSALNTPVVPNAVATVKWKRNIWMRIPFNAIGGYPVYNWNDNNVSDATYLKWSAILPDLTSINGSIASLTAAVAVVTATANNAYALASSVNATAANALSTANGATVTANNASAAAATANNLATTTAGQLTTVQTGITNATNTANAASTAATAAQNAVNAFVAAHNTAVLAQTTAQNTDLGALIAGENPIVLNTKVRDANNIITLTAGKIQFVNAGTYVIDATIPAHIFNERIQPRLIKDSDASIHGYGSCSTEGDAANFATHLTRLVVTVTVIANEIYRLSLYALSGNGLLGKASNLGPEYFTMVRIDQIA